MKIISLFFSLFISLSIYGQSEQDSVTVYYFMSEECRICQYYSLTQIDIYEKYNDDHTSFIGLFPNGFSNVDSIKSYKAKYNIPFPLKKEFFQSKTKLFDARITPEVVVYNEDTKEVIYQGRIDNSYVTVGKRRRVVTEKELVRVLEDLKNRMSFEAIKTDAVGCFIVRE